MKIDGIDLQDKCVESSKAISTLFQGEWVQNLNVHENLPSIDEYKNMLENAGFNVVQCIDITDNYTDFTWDRY